MMGPTALFDKSAFQRLSREDARWVSWNFNQTFPPILAVEILSDLAKELGENKRPEALVAALASKFLGTGPPLTWDFRTLLIGDVAGSHFALTGQIPVMNAAVAPGPDGELGMLIEPSQTNWDLLRWSRGDFREDERLIAKAWRDGTKGMAFAALQQLLDDKLVVIPRARDMAECAKRVDDILSTSDLQRPLLEYLLDALNVSRDSRSALIVRFLSFGLPLARFAPYAQHCLRVLLTYVVGRRFELLPLDEHDEADIQYLFYLPFCLVFSSADTLHKRMAPSLIRPDQLVVDIEELRADLRYRREEMDSLDAAVKHRLHRTFGNYPLPRVGSVLTQIYDRYAGSWPGSGNAAIELTEAETTLAFQEAREIWAKYEQERAAKG